MMQETAMGEGNEGIRCIIVIDGVRAVKPREALREREGLHVWRRAGKAWQACIR